MLKQLKKQYLRLPSWVRNKYFITSLAFVVWMLFFDQDDMISQYKRHAELSELKDKKAFYQKEIEQVRKDKEELFTSDENLEKFARERYRMKKEDEDLFIIVDH